MLEIEKKKEQAKWDARIDRVIEDIMKTHDKDSSGFLDKQETKMFLSEILINLSLRENLTQ
jgi:EF-hand domain pair